MHLRIIGCSPIITSRYGSVCSGYLIDGTILFDCGPGVWSTLVTQQIRISELEIICLSHFHVDHVSDLSAILMARYLSYDPEKRLILCGPEGSSAWFENLTQIHGAWMKKLNLRIVELSNRFSFGGYELSAWRTVHTDNSICLRLTDNQNHIFAYSGDTDYTDEIIPCFMEADMAVIESSNLKSEKVAGHLTPELAGKLAAKSAVKQLILTHMYPEVAECDIDELVSNTFKGVVHIARTGFILDI